MAYVQDLFCVLVAMVSISLLLVDLSSIYVSYEQQEGQRELSENAMRICDSLLDYQPILHEGRRGTFDSTELDRLSAQEIAADLRIEFGFMLRIGVVAIDIEVGAPSWSWLTGDPAEDRGSCVASVSVHSDTGVNPARVTLWLWRM